MSTSDIFTAAAKGNTEALLAHQPLDQMLHASNNSVLHIYVQHESLRPTPRFFNFTTIFGGLWRNSKLQRSRVIRETIIHLHKMCPELLLLTNGDGETALHIAARNGGDEIVEALIEAANASQSRVEMLRKENTQKDTALHLAARSNRSGVVEILCKADPCYSCPPNNFGTTPTYLAAERGHLESLCAMLEFCNSLDYRGPGDQTAIHAAVAVGGDTGLKMVNKLLDKEPTLARDMDAQGWTPLHFAALVGHPRITSRLLDYDRSLAYAAANDGRTSLHIAAFEGHRGVVEKIIESCPDACEIMDDRLRNMLHHAILGNKLKNILDVVQKNVWMSHVLLNDKDSAGNTPLHTLVNKDLQSLDWFVSDCRVDMMNVNKDGLNAVDLLFKGDSSSKMEKYHILERRGARVSNCQIELGVNSKETEAGKVIFMGWPFIALLALVLAILCSIYSV